MPNHTWRDSLVADLRFAVRYFARHKGTTAIIVTVLAISTAANAMIFSMFQSQFLRPAPAVPKDGPQVRIWAQERATPTASWELRGFTEPELRAMASHREVFADVAGWTDDEAVLRGDSSAPSAERVQFVTANYFPAIGVTPAAGTGLREHEGVPIGVMSWKVAEQMYGSAAAAVGKVVRANEVPVQVIGVAPPRFQGALRNMDEPALWLALDARASVARVSPRWTTDDAALTLVGRLAPGHSNVEATALARQVVAAALPDSAGRVGMARTADVLGVNALAPGAGHDEMLMAFAAIITIGLLILLVAWTNVSSLMVAAAVSRRHEIAVRLSLGASRGRVLRQLVTESTLLALSGAAIGMTAAYGLLAWNAKTEIDGVDIIPDLGTLAFVLAIAVGAGILFGLSPALHATRGGVGTAMRDSGTGGASAKSGLQRGFVVAQIALSQPLLVVLGTMLSLVILDYQPLSPAMSRQVIAARFRPVERGAPGQRPADVDSLVSRIAARAEVAGAAPEAAPIGRRGIAVADRVARSDSTPAGVYLDGIAPGWFAVVGVPLLAGRDVALADSAAAGFPVIIGSTLARALWGDGNPIGRVLPSPARGGQDSVAMTVVGVYDAAQRLPGRRWEGANEPYRVYTAHGLQWRHDEVLVRTRGPAAPFVPVLEQVVRGAAPGMPVTSLRTLADVDAAIYRDTVQMAALAGAGGLAALLLASLGLYGVVSLAVRQRTREIGIRIAVGAAPMRVARGFLASGVRLGALALGLGLPLSLVALKVGMAQGVVIAPDVSPVLIGVVIAVILLGVTAAATWLPARRAAKVDPALTLRSE